MVFNAGTRDWPIALGSDRVIDLITTRLLDRLAKGEPLPYDEVKAPLESEGSVLRGRENCPPIRRGSPVVTAERVPRQRP